MVIARNCRFGGEGGGFTVVLNKASFLTVGHDGSMAPQSGPLPNGTGWEGNPQVSALTKPEGRQTHTIRTDLGVGSLRTRRSSSTRARSTAMATRSGRPTSGSSSSRQSSSWSAARALHVSAAGPGWLDVSPSLSKEAAAVQTLPGSARVKISPSSRWTRLWTWTVLSWTTRRSTRTCCATISATPTVSTAMVCHSRLPPV